MRIGVSADDDSTVLGGAAVVTTFAGKAGSQLRIPLTIVPGALTEAEIDAIS